MAAGSNSARISTRAVRPKHLGALNHSRSHKVAATKTMNGFIKKNETGGLTEGSEMHDVSQQ
jgi:hypothetical protein